MARKQNPSGKKNNLSQFGLLDMDNDMDIDNEDLDGDDDLEAELAAITSGGKPKPRPKPSPMSPANLNAMIAESLRDIPSDDEGSGDDDDPDLLNELHELTVEENETVPVPPPRTARPAPPPPGVENSVVKVLQERIANYTLAEKNAKTNGESSRARRFARGLKTLNDLLKQAKAGKSVNEEDIPPIVSVGKQTPASDQPSSPQVPLVPEKTEMVPEDTPSETPVTPDEPSPPESPKSPTSPAVSEMDPEKQKGVQIILRRKEEFKAAALNAKKVGEKALAMEHLKVMKMFDVVLDAYKRGETMDLNELPTPDAIATAFRSSSREEEQSQKSTEPPPPPENNSGLITASSVDEALKQRLAVFQEQEEKAKEAGNASKQRRMGRIVKQYKDAIRLHAAGKPLPEDLPTPPGFAPIPTEVGGQSQSSAPDTPVTSPQPTPAPTPKPKPRLVVTRADKQLNLLLQRQHEFKVAALEAKKNGNITQAKEHLRNAKGLEKLIEASRAGLAVDFDSIPLPPTEKQDLEDTFDVITTEDCDPNNEDVTGDVLTRLHQQLTSQLKLCLATRDHYKAMGNVAETSRFENLAVNVKQDLDLVNMAKRLGQLPPKFHYEQRKFSVIQCNTDLNENDLELSIIRGISYNVSNPKDVDTYVKFEFPYPQEAPVYDRTDVVKDTNNPEYNATFPLVIARGARPCLRVFKRHAIKFEVYSRGGWFSKDSLLGTVTVKLAPLETQTTIHEAFPLMDGRRAAGGSLEVRLRLRTPLLQQQFDNTTHRWLVIDN